MSEPIEAGLLDRAANGAGARLYNEMLSAPGKPRPGYGPLLGRVGRLETASWKKRHEQAQRAFRNLGITFTVYQEERGVEQIFPFDLLPRVIQAGTWLHIERGLRQRVQALNHFLADVYGERRILGHNHLLRDIVLSSGQFRRELCGFLVAPDIRCHIARIYLVPHDPGPFHLLAANIRTPSGESYVLAKRQILNRVFPDRL